MLSTQGGSRSSTYLSSDSRPWRNICTGPFLWRSVLSKPMYSMEIPLGLHITTNRPGGGQEFSAGEQVDRMSSAFLAKADHWLFLGPASPRLTGRQDGPLYNVLAIDPGQNCWWDCAIHYAHDWPHFACYRTQ